VNDPLLLIADEATSMLDVSTRAGIAATLRRLAHDRSLAILFVTHDLGEATQVSDRVVVLRHGRVMDAGPPSKLIDDPGHAYTTELLESARAHTLHTTRPQTIICPRRRHPATATFVAVTERGRGTTSASQPGTQQLCCGTATTAPVDWRFWDNTN
jgi:ABC-type glutathione transport system ATPase component